MRHVAGTIEDVSFDWKFGTDTTSWVALEDLCIESDVVARGVDYHPTRSRPFRKLLLSLDLPLDGAFVDFGCGKGRAVLLAMEYGLKKVKGIEFSDSLCEIARRNISVFKRKTGFSTSVEIFHVNAVEYPIADDDTIFYFFNPFDDVIFHKVLFNIGQSIESAPRDIWLIYYNPIHFDIVEQNAPFLALVGEYDIADCIFRVYRGYVNH